MLVVIYDLGLAHTFSSDSDSDVFISAMPKNSSINLPGEKLLSISRCQHVIKILFVAIRICTACARRYISSNQTESWEVFFKFTAPVRFPRQNLHFSLTLINLVSNESVRSVVLLLPTSVQSTAHYVSAVFLISYHWQQGK